MPKPPRLYEVREDVVDQVRDTRILQLGSGITAICGEARMDG
jgi:hypothetical protein